MSYDPTDHVNDHDDVVCSCGVVYNYTTRFRTCAHPGCKKAICSACLVECECCPGKFCRDHVSAVDDVVACVRCEDIDMQADELLEREAAERAALVARIRTSYPDVPNSVLAHAIIRHAQGVGA